MCRFDSQGKACRVAVTITVLFVQWMFKNGVQERNVGLALCVNLLFPPPPGRRRPRYTQKDGGGRVSGPKQLANTRFLLHL